MTTMTDHDLEQLVTPEATEKPKPIEKVSIVISKGSLEGIYPGLIMANGARMDGMEANVFFTFFGLDAITKKRQAHDQGRDGRQPRHAHPDARRRHPRHVLDGDEDDVAEDGEARHPAHPGVRRDDRRLGRRRLRLQGDASTCSASPTTTSSRRSPA